LILRLSKIRPTKRKDYLTRNSIGTDVDLNSSIFDEDDNDGHQIFPDNTTGAWDRGWDPEYWRIYSDRKIPLFGA